MIPGMAAGQMKPVAGPADPYWANVVFLSHFDGTDGATAFTDEKGHAISLSGAVELDTAVKKFGSAAGLFTSGYVSCASSPDFDSFKANDVWTLEKFCFVQSGPVGWIYGLCTITQSAAGLHAGVHIQEVAGVHNIYIYRQNEATGYYGAITFPRGVFNYIKICNTGSGAPICYINGSPVTLTNFSYGDRPRPSVTGLVIGAIPSASGALTLIGHLDEFRVTQGVARTDSYAVPAGPFPNK